MRFAAETLRFRHRVGAVLLDRIARARSGVEIFLLELVRLRAVELLRRRVDARAVAATTGKRKDRESDAESPHQRLDAANPSWSRR